MYRVNKYQRFKGLQQDFKPAQAESLGKVAASEITEETRHDHSYGCLTDKCNAVFVWVKPHAQLENTKRIRETFRQHAGTPHDKDCPWNFKQRASKYSKDLVFYKEDPKTKEGYFHLRVNFPIGSSWTDQNPHKGRISAGQYKNAEENTGIKSINSMKDCVKFLEKEFGSLDAPEMEYLKLHYQGKDYVWNDVFVPSADYNRTVHVPKDSGTGEAEGRFTVVKIKGETKNKSRKGKVKIACEWQQRKVGKRRETIRPYIVCENEQIAEKIKKMDIALVSGRPFVDGDVFKNFKRPEVPVYLYVTNENQVTPVDDKYWRYYPARANTLVFEEPAKRLKKVTKRKDASIPDAKINPKAKAGSGNQLTIEF